MTEDERIDQDWLLWEREEAQKSATKKANAAMKCSELAADIEMARSTWEVAMEAAKKPEANVYGLSAEDLSEIVQNLVDNYGDMDDVYWKGVGIDMLAYLLDAKLYHEKYGAAP